MPTASISEQIARSIERYPLIRQVFVIASDRRTPIYLVGGTVRDLLLDRDIHDLDFAIPGDGLVLARYIADRLGGAFVPLDRERKTGRVVLLADESKPDVDGPPALYVDIAALRGDDLAADLRARDFTINAMAIELSPDGQWILHDIVRGHLDLAASMLRTASPSSLADDPVRMLRAVRFQTQLGCTVEPATRKCIYETAPLLSQVSPERLRDEWFRILQQPDAADAVLELDRLRLLRTIAPPIAHREHSSGDKLPSSERLPDAIASLRATERLWVAFQGSRFDAQQLIPETLYALTPQIRSRYETHICDERTYLALLKCAALLHDTRPAPNDAGVRPRESSSAQAAAELGRQWRCSNREVSLLYTVALHHRYARQLATNTLHPADTLHPAAPSPDRRAIYRYYQETGEYGVDTALVALANALAQESDPPSPDWTKQAESIARLLAPYLMQQQEWIAPSPLLSGHDLIKTLQLAPGPQIGDLLEKLCEEQAAGALHTREEALIWMRGLLEQRPGLDQKRPGGKADR